MYLWTLVGTPVPSLTRHARTSTALGHNMGMGNPRGLWGWVRVTIFGPEKNPYPWAQVWWVLWTLTSTGKCSKPLLTH
jgi:hypothetical protein